jgi:hypothetical protein
LNVWWFIDVWEGWGLGRGMATMNGASMRPTENGSGEGRWRLFVTCSPLQRLQGVSMSVIGTP